MTRVRSAHMPTTGRHVLDAKNHRTPSSGLKAVGICGIDSGQDRDVGPKKYLHFADDLVEVLTVRY